VKILAISGSLRASSYNTALARAAAELAPPGVEVELYEGLARLPAYDQDLDETASAAPPAVQRLRERIDDADALLVVTPEYNGSIPGVLKNAIDWASARHRGSSFENKTVAIAGVTTGQYGAIWAQQDLRKVLGISGARVVHGELPVSRGHDVFDEDGRLTDPLVAERLLEHLAHLVAEAQPSLNEQGPREAAPVVVRR
jgi:chromate reductase, NAD(P)H dehydrogenase (quinone)